MPRLLVLVPMVMAMVPAVAGQADLPMRHLFLCRSRLLAFDFWRNLQEIAGKGVTITPPIVEQVCRQMRAGSDPQCLRVEAEHFEPVAAGWGGAMAMSDGTTKFWFHNPDAGGWIHPDYYITYVHDRAGQ